MADGWLRENGLALAPHKTEAIHFRYGRRRKEGFIRVAGANIQFSPTVKYLGIHLDPVVSFGKHIAEAAAKADSAVKALARLMPNIAGPAEGKRKVLAHVAQSVMLYGAPVWAASINVGTYRARLCAVQRRVLLRVCRAYRTVSAEAAAVLAGAVPIHLLCQERMRLAEHERVGTEERRVERESTMQLWQAEWAQGSGGRWTYRLIPNISVWAGRGHGALTYYLTQALTGHGSFRKFTYRINKAADENCIYCGEVDTAEHTLFVCPRWEVARRVAELKVGRLTAGNLVPVMLRSSEGWKTIEVMVEDMLKEKAKEERF